MPQDGGANTPLPKDGATPEDFSVCLDAMTLAAYLDDTLDARKRRIADAHLAYCRKCGQAVEELRAIMSGLEPDSEDPAMIKSVAERAKKLIED